MSERENLLKVLTYLDCEPGFPESPPTRDFREGYMKAMSEVRNYVRKKLTNNRLCFHSKRKFNEFFSMNLFHFLDHELNFSINKFRDNIGLQNSQTPILDFVGNKYGKNAEEFLRFLFEGVNFS